VNLGITGIRSLTQGSPSDLSGYTVHLELTETNTDHFVSIDRQVRGILITVHSYSQMTRVREILCSDFHVTTFDHYVVSVKLSVVRGVSVRSKY